MSDLERLAKPFLSKFISEKPGGFGAKYVSHDVVTQYLLRIVGPFGWEMVEILRSDHGPLTNVVCGAVWRLTVTIDGVKYVIEEVGDCENPSNWKTDGARLKDTASDALKRCSMRVGLGLHLWSKTDYILHDALQSDAKERTVAEVGRGNSIPASDAESQGVSAILASPGIPANDGEKP